MSRKGVLILDAVFVGLVGLGLVSKYLAGHPELFAPLGMLAMIALSGISFAREPVEHGVSFGDPEAG